jgi:replicative DNA helicase
LERATPADHEAERAVLGAILLDHEAIWKVRDRVPEDAFDQPRHRTIYRAVTELVDKQVAVTLITLRNHLQENGLLDQVGGVAALTQIADAVPTAAHVEHHAEIVRKKGLARALIRTCESLASRGYDGEDSPEELIEDAERQVLAIAAGHAVVDFTELEEELHGTIEYIRRMNSGEVTGIATGFPAFDDLTGGFDGGDLVILAARPSMGKSALALNIARNHAVDADGCVAVFSLEMTKRQLVLRMIMGEAELDLARLRRGVLADRDMERLQHASRLLEEARIYIDDSGTISVSDIAAKCRRLHREQNLSLVIVDYIQLVRTHRGGERREQEVAEISRSLKLLAKDLDVPILALSQLNRGPELRPNKRPMLADLRESGAIEQDADIVMFIYRDEVYDEDTPDQGIAELIISKQRNGPTGMIKLQFEGRYARFHNLSGREPPPPTAGFDAVPADLDSEPPF